MKYLAITAILCLVLAGASFAGNVTITEVLTGGNLTLTIPNNFNLYSATLGGFAELYTDEYNQTFTMEDARGTGVGWNLGLNISQFTTSGTNPRTIPTSKFFLFLHDSNIFKDWGQDRDDTYGPKSLIGNAYTNVQSSETKVITADAGYGMGKYNTAYIHFRLYLPAETYAGTYTATLTATLNAVP